MTALRILALLLTALIWVPSAAHLLELPGKIGLAREAYLTVQGIYAGWAWFGVPIVLAILANGALFLMQRQRDSVAAGWALVSTLLIATSLAVFFAWTFPANQATANWTTLPETWQTLRRQWEFSHAANALIVFAALLATTMATVRRR